jgi:hypothetical protein
MSTLHVLLASSPAPGQRVPWAVYDAQNRLTRSGAGTPSEWPATDSREAVLAAAAVRLVRVTLPPMPADRVAAAAAFALEDQLAGPAHAQHIVASPQRKDGSVEVAIAPRAPFASLPAQFARVVAEPTVAPVPAPRTWRWYESAAGGGFVRKPDGTAFAVGVAQAGAPAEIALAVAHAARDRALDRVEVAFAVEDAQLRAWSEECGVPFARTAAWHWDQDGAALAAATDLLRGEFSREPRARAVPAAQRFRWALALAVAALALHVGATVAQWAWLRYQAWEVSRSTIAAARAAGVSDAVDAGAAAAALTKRFEEARHRASLMAPGDALPLLARAAPALAALPAGALKTATYASGTWTFDVGKLEPVNASGLDRNLALAGLATLSATTPAGTRVRVMPAPGTQRP